MSSELDLDLYGDLVPQPTINARAGRFQPKANPRPKKKLPGPLPSTSTNDSKEKTVILTDTKSQIPQLDEPVVVSAADDRFTETVNPSTLKEPLKNIGDSSLQLPHSDDPKTSECEKLASQSSLTGHAVGPSSVPVVEAAMFDNNINLDGGTGKSAGKADADPMGQDMDSFKDTRIEHATSNDDLHLKEANSEGNANWDSNLEASGEKEDTMGFVLDPFPDIVPEPASINVSAGRKFQPKFKPHSRKETPASNTSVLHDVTQENLTTSTLTAASKSQHKGGPVGSVETSTLCALIMERSDGPVTSSVDISASRESDDTQVHYFPDSVICTEAAISNNNGNFHINNGRLETEKIVSFVTEYTEQGSIPSLPSNLSQKSPTSLADGEGVEVGESSRRLRKRVPDLNLNQLESLNKIVDDNDDDEDKLNKAPLKKRAQRKSKKTDPENEKPVQKRKKPNEVTDKPEKKEPKTFSHSTRRNKRRVDKILLETPDYEIEFLKVPIKQLILLAEIKERNAKKEAANAKIPSANQSADNSSPRDDSYNEREVSASEDDTDVNGDQAGPPVKVNTGYFNYHTFMDRTPSTRWSKQHTELFYEAIRQFGTDFSMIQQLFPDQTRHQIKLKYNKEARQHPFRLSEAEQNRATDHSHFELVIEKLQQAAGTQLEEDEMEVPGEEDEGKDVNHETNGKMEKYEPEDETKDEMEADGNEAHSTEDNDQNDDEDVDDLWNSYTSL